ncbi:MAG: FAD-dependent oxidoreductase, partial [Delftia sp.]|nr:FAD-dependent oxidoreductase [Delftia sp.]
MKNYDLIVVGAGIVGLAHAYAAARRGRSVLVIERDAACISASIRNFGFVTVTGQQAGAHWQRAMRSRDTWAEIAPQAGIEVVHRGLWLTARRASAEAVLHAFLSTSMGERCELLTPAQAAERHPALRTEDLSAVLYSPHELRVESRTAIARLAQWLEQAMGVDFRFGEAVLDVVAPRVRSTRASYHGERVVVCNNADPGGLFAGLW